MGLLDIDEKLGSVINAEYLSSQDWLRQNNLTIDINTPGQFKNEKIWMKKFKTAKRDNLWVRYEDARSVLCNLSTGERQEITEVLSLEHLVDKWISEAGGYREENKWIDATF
jgi:hypothetical protein